MTSRRYAFLRGLKPPPSKGGREGPAVVGSSGRFITASSPVADVAQQFRGGITACAAERGSTKRSEQCNGLLWAWSSADKSMWARVAVVYTVDGRSVACSR